MISAAVNGAGRPSASRTAGIDFFNNLGRHATGRNARFNQFKNRASFVKKNVKQVDKQEEWGSKSEYILSLIGFAVGIGNIWRFPYLCQKHGGGAFLFAYVVMVIIEGLPLFCLELHIGNHFKKSVSGSMRHIKKGLVGVGWCTITVCFLCAVYYNSIIMWIIRYLFESFVNPLPWSECKTDHICCLEDKTQYYWYYEHLRLSPDIRELGSFNPTLVVCLIISWVTIFICISRGIKSSGKVVYFSATAPYVVLIILLFRGATLDGAKDGIMYFLKPDAKKLLDLSLWSDAASQIFYSLGIGFGAIVSFASFTKNCDNVIRDSIIITVVNCSTSILGGFVIFSIVGYRKHMTGADFDQLGSGPGLAFVAIAEAVANMHISPLWAVLFYSMLLLLGLDSLFGLMESMLHQLREEIPVLKRIKKHGVNACVCFLMFLLALPTATNGGQYIVNLMDTWAVSIPLLFVALGEIVSIVWFYGIHRFTREVKEKTGYQIGWYWQICWVVLSPLVLLILIGFSLFSYFGDMSYSQFIGCAGINSGLASENGSMLETNNGSADYNLTGNMTNFNYGIDYKEWQVSSKLPTEGIVAALFFLLTPLLTLPLGALYGHIYPNTTNEEQVQANLESCPEENEVL
ncbi:sodium- and chloride-dependent transporter XTRP3-like [Bolinopsis microptera]|uniref:sodium- and chloride-dependent transporter XTRP3-like n=1 Tax=Bolinopsis microptera TaxID=2820187 RepID=UPI00307949DB